MAIKKMLTLQDGPPLPPSLVALRLESGYPMNLGQLVHGEARLTASPAPTLIVRSPIVSCSLEAMIGGPDPHAAHDPATAPHAEQFISKLPAGIAALEMHAQRVSINCGAAVQEIAPEAAALVVCLFVASAPVSYRRFSLYWPDQVPLYVNLLWPLSSCRGWQADACRAWASGV